MKHFALLAGTVAFMAFAAAATPNTNHPAFASYAAPEAGNATVAAGQLGGDRSVSLAAVDAGATGRVASAAHPETQEGVSTQHTSFG